MYGLIEQIREPTKKFKRAEVVERKVPVPFDTKEKFQPQRQ
jgi:hypothetical protein